MPAPIATSSTTTRRTTSAAEGGYTIKSGDTLGKIAQQHGVSLKALVDANPQLPSLATDPGKIKPGWVLNLPGARTQQTAQTNPAGWTRSGGAERQRVTGSVVRANDFGNKLSAGGAQAIALNMKAHNDGIDKTGVGRFYGDHSSFKSMSAEEKKAWIEANKTPGTDPAMPKESSCIGWAMENVGAAYRAAGKTERWNEIQRIVTSKGSKGTDLAKELKKDGWESVYWNPDAKNPNDGLSEHSYSAAMVAKGKPYYGVDVDHTVLNYRPTEGKGTKQDLSGIQNLEKVPFFFGLAKGGMHTFVGRDGKVNEFHWNEMPNSKHAIEEKPLKDFGWNSGLIMVPPGSWPK